MKKIISALTVALLIIPTILTSCASDDPADVLKHATEIKLEGDQFVCDSDAVYADPNGRVTISKVGTYALTGEMNDGQIYIDCIDAGKINLILNGVNLNNSDGACIYIKKAQEAVITIEEGTVNNITDGENYTFAKPDDDEPNSAIFSKEDFTIEGNGTLNVKGNYEGGIFSKDGLVIDGGIINIEATTHGIKGKDSLVINGGDITITAEGDGIKSTNIENELVGYVAVNGGKITINAGDEAVQAESKVQFTGGEVILNSTNNGIKCNGVIDFAGGSITIDAADGALSAFEVNVADECNVTIDGAPYKSIR